MNIINYFKGAQWVPKDFEPDPLCEQVAELARGCAREGYIVAALMCLEHEYPMCAGCDRVEQLMAYRVPMGGKQVVCLLCDKCVKNMAHETGHGRIIKWLRDKIERGYFEMAYLFQHGQRIRIVWGHQLGSEVLS